MQSNNQPLEQENNTPLLQVHEFPKITLEAARVNVKLKQIDAAIALGISRSTLQNYESGKTIPDWDVVKKMELLYNISLDFIQFPTKSA